MVGILGPVKNYLGTNRSYACFILCFVCIEHAMLGLPYILKIQPAFVGLDANKSGLYDSVQVFLKNRVHSQYICEAYLCGILFTMASWSYILLNVIYKPILPNRSFIIMSAFIGIVFSTCALTACCFKKTDNYLRFRFFQEYEWPLLEYRKFEPI